MTQEAIPERDPIGEWWETYGQPSPFKAPAPDDHHLTDPWLNGNYALSAVVWGLIFLVVLGVGGGP